MLCKKPNNPRQIFKQLPIKIDFRLSKLSSKEESYDRIKQDYLLALKSVDPKSIWSNINTNNKYKNHQKKTF